MSDFIERYRWFIVAIFAVPLLSGVIYLIQDRLDGPDPIEVRARDQTISDIRVYISGGVHNPGVYALPDGSRWIDALEAAGGPADNANLDAINLARRVQDEDRIIVPIFGGPVAAGESQAPLIDINTASESQLKELPGIGDVRAAAIIRSRETDGPFATIDDLRDRDIIPGSVFENIAELITAGP